MSEVRLCTKCVYHTSGQCTKWMCDGTKTVKDVEDEAKKKFAAQLLAEMEMQESGFEHDPENTVEPSWNLAKSLIEDAI